MLIQRYFIRKKAFRVVQVLLGIIPCWSATDYGEFFSFACSCCSAYNNMCEILIWREKLPNMQARIWFVFIYQPKKQQYHPWTTRTAWKKMSTWICRPCRSTRPCRTTVCRRLGRHRSTHQVSNQGKNEMQRADVERILLQTGLQSSAFENQGGKAQAAAQCGHRGGTLVDIEDKEMYDALYSYIQDEWVTYTDRERDHTDVWLASSYVNGVLRKTSGDEGYAQWFTSHPNESQTGVAWIIATKPTLSAPYIGMYTSSESNSGPVPRCRFSMSWQ